MKIQAFEIVGLNGREGTIVGNLDGSLNILTGRNGAGKTNILKLLWYIMSGNIFLALKEIPFQRATLSTDEYVCTVHRLGSQHCRVEWESNSEKIIFEDDEDDIHDFSESAESKANSLLIGVGSSVFFPTFRRIEGGYSLDGSRGRISARQKNDVEESLVALSRKLTNGKHGFVSAISTVDIVELLLRRYTELSSLASLAQQRTSSEIIDKIKLFKSDQPGVDPAGAANSLLDDIRVTIESMERQREEFMAPFEVLKKTVAFLFRHAGIKIDARFSFGDAANAVNSAALSAGEKQMLSFVCYNAFYKESVIFIDEPELSLHVDWQRQLFSFLQSQQTSNQFIIATHSPFIYSKYPENEIIIDPDRGDGEALM